MREILFRGKRLDNGEWVEGSLIVYGMYPKIFTLPHREQHEVDARTVGQYTGLTDKNGKKIFEGDVVSLPLCDNLIGIANMAFMRFEAQTDGLGNEVKAHCKSNYQNSWETGKYMPFEPECFDVIGNIHDNPELLGGNGMSEYKCMECIHGSVCGDFGGSHAKNCEFYKPESEWIGVKDALPEPDVPVLVTYIGFTDNKPHSDGIAIWSQELNGYNGGWEWTLDYSEVTVEITHWQPLPEPPKENT